MAVSTTKGATIMPKARDVLDGTIIFSVDIGDISYSLEDIKSIVPIKNRNLIIINFNHDVTLDKFFIKYYRLTDYYEDLIYLYRNYDKAISYKRLKEIKSDPNLLNHLLFEKAN